MSCNQALDKFSEKLNSRLLVQKEHGIKKGAHFPPGLWSSKKAWPAMVGLSKTSFSDREKEKTSKQLWPTEQVNLNFSHECA